MRINRSGYKTFREKGKTQSVHKRVVEKKLGGKVWPGHEVHHKNGNKLDNRSSNLQVMKKSEHRKLHSKK
jgi:hypothetical protein